MHYRTEVFSIHCASVEFVFTTLVLNLSLIDRYSRLRLASYVQGVHCDGRAEVS